MPGTVGPDGPTVSLSFANNFWGKDDAGVSPLLDRMHHSKVTGDELKAFYTARAQIEDEYARKLLGLARKPLGSGESGTLRMSLDVVRGEVESMGKQHQAIASQMKSELEEPLAAFAAGLKERKKIVQSGIEKLLKTKNQQTAAVHKSRDKYEQDCLKIKGYLAQGHMVMGQEERKNKAKLEKTQIQMSANSNGYETAVKVLEETTGKWNREWKAACDKFQDLEEERIDYFKSSLWTLANIASTVCVSDDASCEKIRLSLEDCEVEKDITQFIKDSGTGQEIPDPPKYINFCRGDLDDAASQHDPDDEMYSVAQFPRNMNPTYRTSSPQPSAFEAHNDPDSSLRDDMGFPPPRSSLQGDEPFHAYARSSHGSAQAPSPLAASQTSQAYADAAPVPHNPFPADGMTQFCRRGPPSERSAQPSPTRPDSRDSQEHNSDYSAPTSFSSFDPASGQASPTKQYNASNLSAVSAASGDDKTLQKKKSGFFNSPFHRRSQKMKDAPPSSQTTPTTTRNTWTPATTRSAQTSPTKPFGASSRPAAAWGKPSPEPVDSRADYQLSVGNNVFDVASPDPRRQPAPRASTAGAPDPIAQALAELKGVAKQASVRQSADRHYGMATPVPASPFAKSAHPSAPPPAYDQPPISRLGAPQPAHTSRAMQRTTEHFVGQKRDMFNNTTAASRPGSSSAGRGRAASPAPPPRAASPNPYADARHAQPYRAASPNPYGSQPAHRPRPHSANPVKPPGAPGPSGGYGGYGSRGGSPGYAAGAPRAASPNPAYARPGPGAGRPGSSRGDDAGMALQLAPVGAGDAYAGAHRGAGGRPASQYYAHEGGHHGSRMRSQSAGAQRQVTKDGRPILHYSRAMYMYQAAIPEELSFAKGDVLAVTRHQDDGWWEAEVCGKPGPPGLVPSNYLKVC